MPGPPPLPEGASTRHGDPTMPMQTIDLASMRLPIPVDTAPRQPGVTEGWCQTVADVWDALGKDPAALWMSAGGWAAARVMCEQLNRELRDRIIGWSSMTRKSYDGDGKVVRTDTAKVPIYGPLPISGASLAAFGRFLAANGITESGRLALRRAVVFDHDPQPMTDLPDNVRPMVVRDRREALRR